MRRFHFSIDDVFDCVLQLSDWNLSVREQPLLAFLDELHQESGAKTDLYVFSAAALADGRVRRLADVSDRAVEVLAGAAAFRWGPHARCYATAPHAQAVDDATRTFAELNADIARIASSDRRADWVRLHYFSEVFELAPLWRAAGITALMTTDRPAICYRLPATARASLVATGRAEHNGIGFVTSHLRLEFFAGDAADPARFAARLDSAFDRHGFVTVFTHEADLVDPRIRVLARTAFRHAARRGWV